MAKMKKLGVVLRGNKGPFVILGDNKNKDPKYNYSVKLTVVDSSGKEMMSLSDPLLTLVDPRERPNITEEQKARISDKLRYEVLVSTQD